MNPFINSQILNLKMMINSFQQACLIASKNDDGTIDANEKRILEKINKATEKFIRDLEKL